MDRLSILKSAYEILENVTPLRQDCSSLCGQACCIGTKSGDEETGMFLFPGEKELLAGCEAWMSITSVGHIRPDLYLAGCKGSCPRNLRPLSCRVFPLTPYLTENEILLIKMDPRAGQLCPLARETDRSVLHREFVKAVRKASVLLISDPGIRAYIRDLSRMLDDYTSLPWYRLFGGV